MCVPASASVGVVSVIFPATKWFVFIARGKRSAGNVTFVRSGKWGHKLNAVLYLLNQRPGHVWWKRHKDYHDSWLLCLMLHMSPSCAPESVCLRSRQWTANPHTFPAVTDLFKQNIQIQNEYKQKFCQGNNTKQTVQNSHKDSVNRILTTLIKFFKLTWMHDAKGSKHIPQESTEKHQNSEGNISWRSRTHFLELCRIFCNDFPIISES